MRADNVSAETKLHAIDNAITQAIGGPAENALDFIRDFTLGLLEDGQ
jgi:hypothetical protein